MADPRFHVRSGSFLLEELAQISGARLGPSADPAFRIVDVCAVGPLEAGFISFANKPIHGVPAVGQMDGALVVPNREMPAGLTRQMLIADEPQRAFALIVTHFYPPALQPQWESGDRAVSPSASLGANVRIAAGAFIGPNVEIGEGTIIGPNAVLGPGVRIGRWTRIGAGVSISHALIGDRVLIHPNASIGQDGFGFVGGPSGHLKVPQLGRVIIQDDVEIGSLTAIDRGALGDTIVGQGTKFDNLIQIGHSSHVGRHCIMAGAAGLAGSVTLEDFVVIGGGVRVSDHVTVGRGTMVAGGSGVTKDIPAGEVYGGLPARPITLWKREVALLAKMVKNRGNKSSTS